MAGIALKRPEKNRCGSDLPALEKLTGDWAAKLEPAWIKAKQEVAHGSKTGKIPKRQIRFGGTLHGTG